MKRFNTDDRTTEILNTHGAFFAFSKKQFDEQKRDDTTYQSLGHGLICPKGKADTLIADLDAMTTGRIAWELANNTKKEIIWYELGNHECQITCDYSSVVDLLAAYGITKDEIKAEWGAYWDYCVENNYF